MWMTSSYMSSERSNMNIRTLLLPFGDAWAKLVKCVPAIVAAVEQAMEDGKITPQERKDLALAIVQEVAKQFGFKLGGIALFVIGWVIDQIAKKLPAKDVVIPDAVRTALVNLGR